MGKPMGEMALYDPSAAHELMLMRLVAEET